MKRSALFASVGSIVMLSLVFLCLPTGTAHAQDPLKVGGGLYKLVFENERVRVMEVAFKPGDKVGAHSHPDHFGYILSGGKLKISKPDGTGSEIDMKTGEVIWIPAETHAAENTGTTEVRVLVTELKEPAKGPGAMKQAPAAK